MNQNELESEIRKVSRDITLDPRRKDYLIQNLMTRSAFVIYMINVLLIFKKFVLQPQHCIYYGSVVG